MVILQNRYIEINKSKIEIALHILFWLYIFAAININWASNWFDVGLRQDSLAPLSLIIFGLFFYVNTFFLIPQYFSLENRWKYMIYAAILFFLPEVIRIIGYYFLIGSPTLEEEIFSRDSFIFGAPSPFFLALNASFMYRFIKDWFLNKRKIQTPKQRSTFQKITAPYEDANLLTHAEVDKLKEALKFQLENHALYLNPDITLRDLAVSIGSSEKKVSYLLNQHLSTSYYAFINKHRVERFKTEIVKPENKNLSLVGVALNCGFPSKSSFYRAFKANTQMSPSAYVKHIRKA